MRIKIFLIIIIPILSISTLTVLASAQEKSDFCSAQFIKDYNQLINSRKILAEARENQKMEQAKALDIKCHKFYDNYHSSVKCQAEVGDEVTEISSDEHLLMCGLIKESIEPTHI